jgi:hypothetical protein
MPELGTYGSVGAPEARVSGATRHSSGVLRKKRTAKTPRTPRFLNSDKILTVRVDVHFRWE